MDLEYKTLQILNPCIERHFEKIRRKAEYGNYRIRDIIDRIAEKLNDQSSLSLHLFQTCIDLDLMIPKPPNHTEEAIWEELKSFQNGSLEQELIFMYGHYLVEKISRKI